MSDLTTASHEHYWRHATIVDARGTHVPGRCCACGMQTIGGINANLVRAGQSFNDAIAAGIKSLARELETARKRRYEP